MSPAVSIDLSDLDSIEAALDNIGPLHRLLGLGSEDTTNATASGVVKSRAVVQTGALPMLTGCNVVSTDNCLSYPVLTGQMRVVSTLPTSNFHLRYCANIHVEGAYFSHVQTDWYSRLNAILSNLGRLRPGWWGEDSKAPRPSACHDLEQVGFYLPANTKQPDVEVDESTGSVSLIWSQQSPPATTTLVFTGDGTVIGIVTGHSFKDSWKHNTTSDRAIIKSLNNATAKVLLFA